MLERRPVFPNVIELNYQARRRLGCCVYLVYSGNDWLLIDIGYEETVAEIIEMIRQMGFPLANCRSIILTHADADHVQGAARLQTLLPEAQTLAHPQTAKLLKEGERIATYAEITAQQISIDLPIIQVTKTIDEGDTITLGDLTLEVWHTPGHTNTQLSFRMGKLLFSGDNLFRDGCVGNIDAHHGSDLEDFIRSLERIRDSEVEWLLPSHGPIFRKDRQQLQNTIERLRKYLHMADFGTCAIDWPLLDEWEKELAQGFDPASPHSVGRSIGL